MSKALMIVGTSSYAGKSLIVTALCRIFRDKGYRVTPFKAQNMSLNSTATPDGKEISRAQALQALAAGIECSSDMNPILLKPKGGGVSQVVLNGAPFTDISAQEYYASFVEGVGAPAVRSAFNRLIREYDIVVMEGAGSPAEINLYERDIANLATAEMADADVILVADIERGGVFASIYGTLALLKPEHMARVKGVIINKFRGDVKLLEPGLEQIERLVDVPVIGVVPYLDGLRLPAEDSQSLSGFDEEKIDIAVLRLPKISNFTDFDPLAFDHRINLRYISSTDEMGNPDALIIPGTKSTIDDLEWLKESDLFDKIRGFAGNIPIVGICGGFQILGLSIVDSGVETGMSSAYEGLSLLEVESSFETFEKTTKPVTGIVASGKGIFEGIKGMEVSGYEIHSGATQILDGAQPVFTINGVHDGAADSEGMTFGTYLHGLFDSPSFREHFIQFILKRKGEKSSLSGIDVSEAWEESIEKIAETVDICVDLSWFYKK